MTAHDDSVSDPSLAACRRTRALATGLLVLMAGLFAAALAWEPSYPALAWLRSLAEAAMVGALADWYAVTALFKRPLGLPIPHTEIVPRNKERIAASLGQLTQRKLVTPEAVARLIGSWRIPEELTAALLHPERRRSLTLESAAVLARLIEASEDAAMQRCLRHAAAKALHGVSVAPLAGQLLSAFLRSPRRDRLLNDLLDAAGEYLEAHRESLCRLIADKLPWSRALNLINLDEKVAKKLVDWLRSVLRDMRDDPDDPVRRRLVERLESAAQWLRESERAVQQESIIKGKLLQNEALLGFLDESWHDLKRWLLDDLKREASETRAYLDAALAGLGDALRSDPALLQLLHRWLHELVVDFARRHGDKVGELVTATVRDWSTAHMIDTIDREVGKDLQFIRINGTVVGGAIGLLLHAIAVLIG